LLLVQSQGRALSKQELMSSLWPDTFVEEANLSFQISTLRKALGDDDADWIETVPKHGYRFAAPVVARPHAAPVAPAAPALAPPVSPATAGPAPTTTRWLVGGLLAVIVVALAGARYSGRFGSESSNPVERSSSVAMPLTTYPGVETAPSLSPDGSQVAFVWNGTRQDNYDIYLKLVGPGGPQRLTDAPEYDDSPAWSPDGSRIAFLRVTGERDGEVWVMPATPGGAQKRIATLRVAWRRKWHEIEWSPDGKWLVVGQRPSPADDIGLWLLEVDGDRRHRLTTAVKQGWQFDVNPVFSPDGRRLAFVRLKASSNALFVQPLSDALEPIGEPVVLNDPRKDLASLAWPDNDSLVVALGGFVAPKHLERIPLSRGTIAPAGQPVLLPFGERATAITLSRTGRLVYSAALLDTNFWKLDVTRSNSELEDSGLDASTLAEGTPDYSPFGDQVVFTSTRSGSEELWISKIDGTGLRKITTMGGAQCSNAQWSPHGDWILFNSSREGSTDLYLVSPVTLELQRITTHPAEELEAQWSRDGEWIYFVSNRTGPFEIWKRPKNGVDADATPVTHHGGADAQESIDKQFLYYAKPSTPTEIWRVPVAGGEEQRVVGGLSRPMNFVVVEHGIYFIAVGDAPSKTSVDFFDFATGKRKMLAPIGKTSWFGLTLSPDRRWLLFPTVDREGRDLMVVDGVR
jgi:Tol biopolymer transport system component